MATKKSTGKNKPTFEEAIKELTTIVSKIEQGEIPLQQSIEQYEKGMKLIGHCREILKQAETRIEKISKSQQEEDDEGEEELF